MPISFVIQLVVSEQLPVHCGGKLVFSSVLAEKKLT